LNITVIGVGYVGLNLAISAAQVGFKVNGYDTDLALIESLNNFETKVPGIDAAKIENLIKIKNLNFTNDETIIDQSDIIIIAVPTPIDKNQIPDMSFIKSACETISRHITKKCLIINESTSYPGTLRNYISKNITSKYELLFAVAPERVDPGNVYWNIHNTPRILSGLTEESIKAAEIFYSKFCNKIFRYDTPEIVETAKLLENTFRFVNIALINELSDYTSALGIPINSVVDAAATKPFGFLRFNPGIGVGGHCIPIDPLYLKYSADQLGVKSKLIEVSNDINSQMPLRMALKLRNLCGGKLAEKKIQIIGISYKSDVPDIRESPAIKLIQILRGMGAKVSWNDPIINKWGFEESLPVNNDLDFGIIVTPYKGMDLSTWVESKIRVFDFSTSVDNFGWPKFFIP
jgi:UDP-N-acetyl-D-glucosamine dehydrogenase